jgi:hypothetical protein
MKVMEPTKGKPTKDGVNMIDTKHGYYLDLEQKLFTLRTHFEMCRGAKNEDVQHWAKFFREWARKAVVDCGPWCRNLCVDLDQVLKDLEKNKMGDFGYEIIEHLMAKAAFNLNAEILDRIPRYQKA